MINHERTIFLKQLYQRKFYEESNAKGALQKVINFQKKMQDFKVSRNYTLKVSDSAAPLLYEEETSQFRPSTNSRNSHHKREKMFSRSENRRVQGPATAELRLILENKKGGQFNILTENMRDKNLYSVRQSRKRAKLFSRGDTNRHERNESESSRLTPIDIGQFYHDQYSARSERRVRPIIYREQSVKQNEEDSLKKSSLLSKRVFIGGRNLQKAGEEYFHSFKEMNRNIELYQLEQKRKLEMSRLASKKASPERKRIKKVSPRKSLSGLDEKNKLKAAKTEPKINQNYEEIDSNMRLDPWNVADPDYS